MAIQWFPGHMTSALKEAARTLAQTGVVIEVCDARLPEAGSNPTIRALRLQANFLPNDWHGYGEQVSSSGCKKIRICLHRQTRRAVCGD
jgi:hypothetical protein